MSGRIDGSEQNGSATSKRSADLQAVEPRRRDAEDVDGHAVDGERAADRARIAADLALPELVAHDRAGQAAAGPIVGGA